MKMSKLLCKTLLFG